MKETCCDKQKPKGAWKNIPLAFVAAIGTLAVLLSVESRYCLRFWVGIMLKDLWDDFRGVEINTPPKKVGITVTDAALEKIASMCVENNMEAVRPYVMGGGCGGMQHGMTFADTKDHRDTEVAPYVYIDPVALSFMEGATIHYDTDGMSPTFVFSDVFQRSRVVQELVVDAEVRPAPATHTDGRLQYS